MMLSWLCEQAYNTTTEHTKTDTDTKEIAPCMQINYIDYSPRALVLTVMLPVMVVLISSMRSCWAWTSVTISHYTPTKAHFDAVASIFASQLRLSMEFWLR